MSTNLIIFGGGKIGHMIAAFLQDSGDYQVTIADNNEASRPYFEELGANFIKCDVSNQEEATKAATGQEYVVNACPFHLTPTIATAAKSAKAHYFDLTEDVANTNLVREMAKGAESAFMPQCGLAPGFVSIAANFLAQKFDEIEELRMRVGALPKYPTNALKYNLTWSTDGLINEYCNLCDTLIDGTPTKVAPLEELENFSLEGIDYEAFNTSGGLGTLCESLKGKAKNVNYKSIRYPGHRNIMRFMLNDLKFKKNPDDLVKLFDKTIPATEQDTVLVFNTALGYKDGRYLQHIYTTKVYAQKIGGRKCTAIQVTTAAGICTAIDLMREGKLPNKGFVKQEQISLDDFIANRFGKYYSRRSDNRGE